MDKKDVAKRASEAFNVSLNTIYRYIRELEKAEIISKTQEPILSLKIQKSSF